MFTVFIDRDGTIGGTGDWEHPLHFQLYKNSSEAIKLLKDKGIKVFLFTNQGRIAQGYFKEEELHQGFNNIQQELSKVGTAIDGFYYCSHQEVDNCNCCKPKPGMLIRAQLEHLLDNRKCYVVGDKGHRDMVAAEKAGMKKVLVKTGWGERSITSHRHLWSDVEVDYVALDIADAVQWIVNDMEKNAE